MPAILAILAAILVALWPTSQYYQMIQDGNNRSVVAVTAGQFDTLLSGIKKYIRAHSDELINDIPVGSSTAVSLATLITERDLPVGFTSKNPYNQTWVAYVTQSGSGVLDGRIISYGGLTLSPKDAVAIALKAGAQGGYVPPNGLMSGLNSNMAVGASGTWSQIISGFPNPGAGHLVGLVASADDANNNPNYLYRDSIADHPELNSMETALNMTGNNINSAGDVHAYGTVSSGNNDDNNRANAYMSEDGRVNATKDIRGQIFRPNFVAEDGQPCNGVDIGSGAMDDMASNNQDQSFTVQTGDIARDIDGYPLSCVDNVWRSNNQFSKIIYYGNSGAYTNNTNQTVFIMISGYFSGGRDDYPYWYAFINGNVVCRSWNNSTANWVNGASSCSVMLPSGYSLTTSGNSALTMMVVGK